MGVATATGTTSAQIDVQIAGAPLNPMVEKLLISAEVDTSLHLPSQFKLVFRGQSSEVLLPGGLQLGVLVTLQVTTGGAPAPLLMGEITGVEMEYGPEGRLTIVRGLDRSHRLMRGTVTMAYPEMTASDVVTMLVGKATIPPGTITPTSNTYEWLSQPNVSPWVFIQQLAHRENYVAYVDPMGFFAFTPMPKPEEGLPPVMSYEQPAEGTQLVLGKSLIRLRASVSGAEQVPAVTVTGYDPKQAMPILGPAPALPSGAQPLDPLTLPAAVGGELGAGPFFDASRPVDSEGEAMSRAQSIAADIAGSLSEMEGECTGNPAILAGKVISIGMAGPPFDGQYVCTSARHSFDPGNGGYTTWFTVGGFRDRTLYSLTSGSATDVTNQGRVPGLVVGTVMDNMDPDSMGRVKVMFPWLSGTYVSAWARTMQIGAGKLGGYGFLFVPEVGDEVLVGFDRGDIDHPYVIGNLYNGMAKPEPAPSIQGAVANRRIMSRMKHMIQFDDGPDAMGITIQVGTQTCTIQLDGQQQQITIKGEAGITLEAASGDIALKAVTGNVTINGDQGISMESFAGQVQATGTQGVSLKTGSSFQVQASTASIEAPSISLG